MLKKLYFRNFSNILSRNLYLWSCTLAFCVYSRMVWQFLSNKRFPNKGGNFISILCAVFYSFNILTVCIGDFFEWIEIGKKAACKMLMKLTAGLRRIQSLSLRVQTNKRRKESSFKKALAEDEMLSIKTVINYKFLLGLLKLF